MKTNEDESVKGDEMKGLILFLSVASFGFAMANTHTNQWIGGETGKWNAATSYSDGIIPGAVETDRYVVELPDDLTIRVDVSDTESFSVFNKIYLIRPAASTTSRLEFSIAKGESVDVEPAISHFGAETHGEYGVIIKKGAGTLRLRSYQKFNEGGRSTDYFASMRVDDGTLCLPDVPESGKYVSVGIVTVNSSGTFSIASFSGTSATGSANTKMLELHGAGRVTASPVKSTAAQTLRLAGNGLTKDASGKSTYYGGNFSGVIDSKVKWFSTGCCTLSGIESTMVDQINHYDNKGNGPGYAGSLSVMKVGNAGEPSSVGSSRTIEFRENGGVLTYLGDGETTDKTISIKTTEKGPFYLDGGANGGLIWKGAITHQDGPSGVRQHDRLVLTGSNTAACVFSGSLKTTIFGADAVKTNYDFHVAKEGSGTWRIEDNADNAANRTFAGGMTIREGTLQFTSIENAGIACSLGFATNLHEFASGFALPYVDYAFTLGNKEGGDAVLESVGTNLHPICENRAEDRRIALDGRGTLKSSGRWIGIAGIFGKTVGNHTLVLDGTNTEGNVVTDITDGQGVVSVEKNGTGTWAMGRETSFSGSLVVNAGKLIVRKADRYSWYKWLIQESADADLTASQFALYDEDGVRQNVGLVTNDVWTSIKEGEVSFGSSYAITNRAGSMETLFTGVKPSSAWQSRVGNYVGEYVSGTYRAMISKPDSWVPVVMRLPSGANDVDSYDWVATYAGSQGNVSRNPKYWSIEASVDGLHWEVLDEKLTGFTTNVDYYPEANGSWFFAGTAYASDAKEGPHTKGRKLSRSRPAVTFAALENITSVSIALGAELVAEGGVVPLPENIKFVLDCSNTNGVAKLSGFSLPEEGTIDVIGYPRGKELVLPFDFSGSENIENLSQWAVTADGLSKVKFDISISADGFHLKPHGLMMIVR